MPIATPIKDAQEKFADHYAQRLEQVESGYLDIPGTKAYVVKSPQLREDNFPMIIHHDEKTRDVIVLTHGLSDSPYYMQAVGDRFYQAGLNAVLPLLPGHGLKDPDKAMEDKSLDQDWRDELDQAVEAALLLGDRVSLGGFSTGGALSLNKLLRTPEKVAGGLFLFSAALDLGSITEKVSDISFFRWVAQFILQIKDGVISGLGPNPYKYPELPEFAGLELGQIINENEEYLAQFAKEGRKIPNPVFAAHSVHDTRVKMAGLLELFENHLERGLAFIISEKVRHEEVVLAHKIDLLTDDSQFDKFKDTKTPMPNPKFDLMMATAIELFRKYASVPVGMVADEKPVK
jgi:pimeloyl-ACP methyl ester carboxylesterase